MIFYNRLMTEPKIDTSFITFCEANHCFFNLLAGDEEWLTHDHLHKGVLTVYLEVSDVGEEEADKGKRKRPFRDGADDVSSVALKDSSH